MRFVLTSRRGIWAFRSKMVLPPQPLLQILALMATLPASVETWSEQVLVLSTKMYSIPPLIQSLFLPHKTFLLSSVAPKSGANFTLKLLSDSTLNPVPSSPSAVSSLFSERSQFRTSVRSSSFATDF